MTASTTPSTDNWDKVRQTAEAVLGEEIVERIREARSGSAPESHLISILHKTQAHFGYLGRAQLDAVAQLLRVPSATVSGVATFYHFFRLTKPARFNISVCMGTACYVKGAAKVLDKLKEELGIDVGETTSDGLFGLQQARCLGACGLAPVMTVNDETLNGVTPESIPALLDRYARQPR